MCLPAVAAAILLIGVQIGSAQAVPQSSDGFAGLWRFDPEKSEVGRLPSTPEPFLKVEQDAKSVRIFGSAQQEGAYTLVSVLPLDGQSEKRKVGNDRLNTAAKWEGTSLLVSTLVSGPRNYSVMDYWKRSRDGSTLTITRTIVRSDGESESTLVYENPAFVRSEPASAPEAVQPVLPVPGGAAPDRRVDRARTAQPVLRTARPEMDPAAEYVVSSGTHVLLRLTNSLNTKHSAVGDQVFLETAAPVYVNGRLIIPVGSYVNGTVTESHQAGRVKGKSGLNLRIDTLTLPNGVVRDFRTRVGNASDSGKVGPEGQIEGAGGKGRDAGTVAQTTAAGAGIGSVIGAASGHALGGLGIGSAAGAAAGLASIFASRGADVVLPRGSTLELVLERDLRYFADEISMRVR